MSNRALAVILAVLAAMFLVLDVTVDAGTILLILAVAAAIGCVVVLSRVRRT